MTDILTIMTSTSQLIVTSAHYDNCKGVRLQRILGNDLIEVTWFLSLCQCVLFEKMSATKSLMMPLFCMRNRWWLSTGPYLQESHAPCSLKTACLVFLAQVNFEDNSEFSAT